MSAARKQRKRRALDVEHPRVAELDALMARDHAWFERHPGRRHYVRLAEPVERFDLKHFRGEKLPPEAVVLTAVREIAPGVRLRAWRAYSELPGNPDLLDEAGAKALWALWSGAQP